MKAKQEEATPKTGNTAPKDESGVAETNDTAIEASESVLAETGDTVAAIQEPSAAVQEPPAKLKKKAGKAKKKSQEHVVALQNDALARLQQLRSVIGEISVIYLANLERDIVELSDLLSGAAHEGDKQQVIKGSAIAQVVGVLDKLSVKPGKGRRKDLRRIERAVDQMIRIALKKKGK